MNPEDGEADERRMVSNGSAWRRQILTGIFMALAAGTGTFGYMTIDPPRPDPWTANDAARQRTELVDALMEIRKELLRLRAKDDEITKYGQALAERLGALPPPEWQRRIRRLEIWAAKQDDTFQPGP